MKKVERYSDKHKADIERLVQEFYNESLKEYEARIEKRVIDESIERFKKDSFLLIVDGKFEGLLAGFQTYSPISGEKVYQEMAWYVNSEKRKYGVMLLYRVQELLRKEGYTRIILSCMHNSKTEKLFKFYGDLGFIPFETHFIKQL